MSSRHNKKEPGLDRRQFLIKAGVTCGLAAGAGAWGYVFYSNDPVRRSEEKIYSFKNYRTAASKEYPVLAIMHGKNVDKMIRTAIDKLGGISRFINQGEKVLIKPNIGWDRQPEQAANTNPEVVEAVVRLCKEAGASEVWVNDVSINDPYRSFARSGIEPAVKRAGGKLKFTNDSDFLLTDLKGHVLKVWPVSKYYHQVDKVINLPVVKHHSLSKCTISMKNWYGVLGGQRNRLHQEIDLSITDLAAAIRPTLTVADATRVLVRNGPTGGSLSDVSIEDTIIAGLDEVAIDSYCIKFLGLKVEDVRFLKIAENRRLGVTDWKSLDFVELSV